LPILRDRGVIPQFAYATDACHRFNFRIAMRHLSTCARLGQSTCARRHTHHASRQTHRLLIGVMALGAALLTACGGGSDSSDSGGNTATLFATLVRVAAEPAGSHCAAAGVRIDAGMDRDSNGTLADAEVTATQYVCNGAPGVNGSNGSNGSPGTNGSNGTNGANGIDGKNGLSTLVRVQGEPAGSHCAQGGSAVQAGLDTNANGVLENSEVTSTSYVCNGATGATGATGSTGSAGTDGYSSLVLLSNEAAGANCAYGGQRVQSGLDTNRNGALDASEVTSTSYLCSAAPADTQWVRVTGPSAQMRVNTGYLVDAGSPVTLTLPTSPSIGDWVRVTGVSAAGWTLAQNAGQRISTRGLPGGMDIRWTPRSPSGNWTGVAMSSDGIRQVAAAASGNLYTSTDGGISWTLRASPGAVWSGVASSADGIKLVAVSNGGSIYLSADAGATWTSDASSRAWSGVASSADGTRLVAVEYLGRIWTSQDSGATWVARDSNRAWRAVSSSADGRVLVAGTNGAQLYVSTDYGVTWTARATAQFWWSTASSADGKRLYASVDTGAIWTSNDEGTTWESTSPNRTWRGLATSSDGRYVVAATDGGTLYESTDFGVTWRSTAESGAWPVVASSADGLSLLAAKSGATLFTGSRRVSTTPGITGSISGGQEDALQLQYVGGGLFLPISYVSSNLRFTAQ
jgi:hypothetical protein